MKKLFYLINFELSNMLKKLILLCACMIAIESVSFLVILFNTKNHYLRFEELLDKAGYPLMFYIFLGLLLVIIAFGFYQNYFGSKSIYTLLTLPSKRGHVYLGKYISGLLCSLMLAAVQIIGVFLAYSLYLYAFSDIPRMNNALFLAFIRSEFLRMLLPFDFLSLVASIICINSLIVLILFAVIGERSRNYFSPVVFSIILFRIFAVIPTVYRNEISGTLVALAGALILTAMMIFYSLKTIERSGIL